MKLTTDVPELARRQRGRKRSPRVVGPTLAAEISLRIAAGKLVDALLAEARSTAPDVARGITQEMAADSVAVISLLVRSLQIVQDAAAGEFRRAAARIFGEEEARHRRDFAGAVRAATGQDVSFLMAPGDVVSEVRLAVERSVNYVSGIGDEVRKRIVAAVMEAGEGGARSRDLASDLSEIAGFGRKRAKFVARDQIATFNGVLNEVRQVQVGFDKYVWRTSLDERVRPLHAQREGKIFPWARPPSDGHPGQPINCRCTAQAYLDLG